MTNKDTQDKGKVRYLKMLLEVPHWINLSWYIVSLLCFLRQFFCWGGGVGGCFVKKPEKNQTCSANFKLFM